MYTEKFAIKLNFTKLTKINKKVIHVILSEVPFFLINCCMMRSISIQNFKTIAVENQIIGTAF